ncbi:radical SAM/SPASM domain-containing protein [Butyrivibrio sp. NC2002]|uniref:radical SAM/SPASM domain-containing protein n=1 Tax=Butyrivibrio sp. NC2002 TaxID=1410610 RepID=UPI0005625C9F|nr:radical SAM/SPASM domain-containing protein [Butyrivibrio sp. NC2002]
MDNKFGNNINLNRINLGQAIPLEWPLLLLVELSGYCNFECKFCPHGTENDNLVKNNMDFKLFKKIVEELDRDQAHIAKIRYCGMGEMLINPNAVDMMSYLRDVVRRGNLNVECLELITNGSLFNKINAKMLCESVDRIVISVEGLNSEEYQSVTGTAIDYEAFLEGIVNIYANKGNCEIVVKIQGNSIKSEHDKKKFELLFEDKADLLSIENLTDMWPGYETKLVDTDRSFRYHVGEGVVRKKVCAQIFKSLQIYANGDVVPCCFDWERLNYLGNVREKSIKEIWNGSELRKLIYKHLMLQKDTFEPCNTCYGNDYCDIDAVDDYREEILKRMTF